MIVLHCGQEAEITLEKALSGVGGQLFRTDPDKRLMDQIDSVSRWMADSDSPQAIVVNPASAQTEDELEAYRSLRRMAKTGGIDVHLIGDRSVQDIADRTVSNESELIVSAPGSSVGPQIADLMRSETMTEFERVEMDIPTISELMRSSNLTEKEAEDKIAWMKSQAVWANNLYQVNVEFMPGERAHLIIRRLDKQAVHNWQHFQEIKNRILGPDCEAVEVYPSENQLVDEKHHYHLWGFRSPEHSFGIGFRVGRKTS